MSVLSDGDFGDGFHELCGARHGQLACALSPGWFLVIKPNHDPLPLDSEGYLDWTRVTAVEVHGIVDSSKEELEFGRCKHII